MTYRTLILACLILSPAAFVTGEYLADLYLERATIAGVSTIAKTIPGAAKTDKAPVCIPTRIDWRTLWEEPGVY